MKLRKKKTAQKKKKKAHTNYKRWDDLPLTLARNIVGSAVHVLPIVVQQKITRSFAVWLIHKKATLCDVLRGEAVLRDVALIPVGNHLDATGREAEHAILLRGRNEDVRQRPYRMWKALVEVVGGQRLRRRDTTLLLLRRRLSVYHWYFHCSLHRIHGAAGLACNSVKTARTAIRRVAWEQGGRALGRGGIGYRAGGAAVVVGAGGGVAVKCSLYRMNKRHAASRGSGARRHQSPLVQNFKRAAMARVRLLHKINKQINKKIKKKKRKGQFSKMS